MSTRKGAGKAIAAKKAAVARKVAVKMSDIKRYDGLPGVGTGSANPVIREAARRKKNTYGTRGYRPATGRGTGM